MKRNVLRIFSFLLILLVFFTLISPKVEEEMATLADGKQRTGKQNRNLNVSLSAITWPESNEVLFTITEGSGWETGLKITYLPSNYFEREFNSIILGPGTEYWYINSASRQPVPRDTVIDVDLEAGSDTYLFWHPEAIEEMAYLPNYMEILGQTDQAVLVSSRSANHPFFEHSVWNVFRVYLGDELRIYSLHDVEQFTDALPWITGVFTALLCSMILWASLWDPRRSKWAILLNILLIAAALTPIPWLLQQFDLPASLMPPVYILDLGHYAEAFQRITAAMKAMDIPTVHSWLTSAWIQSSLIAGCGILLTTALLTTQSWIFSRQKKESE